MIHRPIAILGLSAILAIAPATARGSIIPPTYTFTNTSGGPVARADFEILPPGSVQPPVIGTDPATGLPRTTSPVTLDAAHSSGFDPGAFSTALGTGAGVQGLRLLFGEKQVTHDGHISFEPVTGPNGAAPRFLESGGTVTFMLNPGSGLTGAIKLVSLTKGVPDPTLIVRDPGGTGTGGGGTSDPGVGGGPLGGGGQVNIPEPITLVLWTSVAGLGALRARRRLHR